MSLLKILILLPSIWLYNVSWIPPNSPPDKSERVYGAYYEYYILPNLFPIFNRLYGSIPCIAELAILFAIQFPSTPSSRILSHLVPSGQPPTSVINRYFIVGSILVTIGGLGRLWCYYTMGRNFTYHLSVRKDHDLVTTGPYAIVRHPSYLCLVLITFGVSFINASPGSFMRQCGWLETTLGKLFVVLGVAQNVLMWVLARVRSRREDKFLQERFREEWERYSERVRYRLIPGVY